MRDLASGLQVLRSIHVMHRDLKPENLLLSKPKRTPAEGRADIGLVLKIADFGMARTLASGGQNLAATQCGSPAFMAPEVLLLRRESTIASGISKKNRTYDDKADLWSVGCILYFMLTKSLVTPASNHMELALKLEQDMIKGVVKTLPQTVTSDRQAPGTVAEYTVAASAATARCRKQLAAEAGVPPTNVRITGSRTSNRPAYGSKRLSKASAATVIVTYEVRLETSSLCQDLLRMLLVHQPEGRCSWQELFHHPWIAMHDQGDTEQLSEHALVKSSGGTPQRV